MANFQEIISKICPSASFEEGQTLLVNVPAEDWRKLAVALKENAGLKFDVLTALIGMDWKDSLGVIYYFTSTSHNWQMISVKVAVADREKPMIHTVSDLWKVANFQEREVYDFYGIEFIEHPDMRRFFLRNDWVGYPLRKDYDADPELNPIRMDDEENEDDTYSLHLAEDGQVKRVDGKVFEPGDYVVNIGPQHPSTHGVMRFRAAIDGETVKKVDVVSGYIHRGIEKLSEGLTYPQTLHFTDRMDYMSAHMNRHCLCMCIEKALGIEVPERAQVIRTMMDELMRISSHLLAFGCTSMDMGATTCFFYGFRERELVLDIFEKTCGARMSMNYNVIGGVVADLHEDFVKDVKELCSIMPSRLAEYHKVFSGNIIAKNRMVGVGMLPLEDAINYDITGPSGRGSNWSCDTRKKHPYASYADVKFDEVLEDGCDSFARYMGEKTPYRLHFQSPCFNLVGVMDLTCKGSMIADLIVIGAALDFVIPDIDR